MGTLSYIPKLGKVSHASRAVCGACTGSHMKGRVATLWRSSASWNSTVAWGISHLRAHASSLRMGLLQASPLTRTPLKHTAKRAYSHTPRGSLYPKSVSASKPNISVKKYTPTCGDLPQYPLVADGATTLPSLTTPHASPLPTSCAQRVTPLMPTANLKPGLRPKTTVKRSKS